MILNQVFHIMKIKRTSGLLLLIIAIAGLPVAMLLNHSAGKVFSKPFTFRVLHEQVFSTPRLAFRLRAVVNERIKEVTDLKTGMIVAVFSKADSRKWQELLDGLLPEELRKPVIDEVLKGAYEWLENDETYPDVVIQIRPVVTHVEANTEFLFRWAHAVASAPIPDAREVSDLKSRNYGDSIPPLLMTNVPDSLYNAFARRGGELMAARLHGADLPVVLDLTLLIREKVPEKDMLQAKATIRNIRFMADWLWVLMLVILAGGIWLYGPKNRDLRPLAINILGAMAMAMLALAWMAGNYLLADWELAIHAAATDVPRTIRDQLTALITYYLNHASAAIYLIGFLLLGLSAMLYATGWVNLKSYNILPLKNKKS